MYKRQVQGEPHVAGRHPDGRLSFLLNDFSGLPADAEAGGTGHSPEPAVHRRNQRAGPMDLQYFVELFCGGLTRGSIYALIALGYTCLLYTSSSQRNLSPDMEETFFASRNSSSTNKNPML